MKLFRQTGIVVTILTGLLVASTSLLAAPDYAREKRWHDEITPSIVVGELVYLTQSNQHRFLGIYTETDDSKMGLVVVHGMGIHPDWGMVNILRERLAEDAYTTLSIQMPVLSADASPSEYPAIYPDAAERLKLAVGYLKQHGHKRIAIVSHSNGSRMSRVYMLTNPPEVSAWAALSLTQGDTFDGIKTPILDLYGENDLSHVLSSVARRKASFNGNTSSKQVVIPGADHFFAGHEEDMVKSVKNFLDRMQ